MISATNSKRYYRTKLVPVVLSGGCGSRLWPLSRANKPKQFLSLFDNLSLFQHTLTRLDGIENMDSPMIVCNEQHRFMVAEQLRMLSYKKATILLESQAKSTAAAMTLAAMKAIQRSKDAVLLVLPADHVIGDTAVFQQTIQQATQLAQQDHIVTLGVNPNAPVTGYGYIEIDNKISANAYAIKTFHEKPDAATAEDYMASDKYFWNSGVFIIKAALLLAEMDQYMPSVVNCCEQALATEQQDLDFIRFDHQALASCPEISFDCAVMEKTTAAVMLPLNASWRDIGSWSSLWEKQAKDAQQNVLTGDVIVQNVHDSYIYSDHRLVTALGVTNLIIIETADAIFVADKSQAESVKQLVNTLLESERKEVACHRKVYRPWGYYDSLDYGTGFQVKRLYVKPGEALSLQKHYHRAEHWIVVAGYAEVTKENQVVSVTENQSIDIPIGHRHRLYNPGKIPLQVIEIQSGRYLGEDDIIRFDDKYHRKDE